MSRQDPKRGGQKPPKEFYALRQFFSAYLHQDFRDEYGSAANAAEAYYKDARKDEIAAVRLDWREWRAQLGNSSLDQIQSSVRKLGAAWQPQSVEDLNRLGEALEGRA